MGVRSAIWVFIVGAAVWGFAFIGVFSVVRAIGADAAPTERPESLLPPPSEIPGQEVAGLPRYEGSSRSEYRRVPFGNLIVTEAEYVIEAPLTRVRDHYEDAFHREGWTVVGSELVHGEWNFAIARGERAATVEIQRVDGVTEVELEVSEPLPERDSRPDR
jgi:hypothetical protein